VNEALPVEETGRRNLFSVKDSSPINGHLDIIFMAD
jgi:hypothetical protein